MKKWLIPLVGLTVAVAATTAVVLAVGGDGTGAADLNPGAQANEPAAALPPIRSDEGIDPNECNWVHNITACDDEGTAPVGPVDEPSDQAPDQYEVTVQFNASVTQEDIEEADGLLRRYDDGLEFLIQESFPPTGRAFVATDASDFCPAVQEQLGAKSYVHSVSCQPWQESGDAEPDVPVEHRNDMTK